VVNSWIGHPAEELLVVRSSPVRIWVVEEKNKLQFPEKMVPVLSPTNGSRLSDSQVVVVAGFVAVVVALVFVNAFVCVVRIFLPILEFCFGKDSDYNDLQKMKV
jgi:hypothetical protein